MKFFILIGLLSYSNLTFASLQSFNGTYSVTTYDWCNGPAQGPTVGCWPFGWQGVDLGKLVDVKIESLGEVSYFTLRDSNGKTWSSNLVTCGTGKASNCNTEYTKDSKGLDINFGNSETSMSVIIDDKEISLLPWLGSQRSYLVFKYSKN